MISVKNLTKTKSPRVPVERIVLELLGKNHELSLVYIGDQRSKTLNFKYRNKDYPTNILTFPVDENTSEIFINLNKADKEYKKSDLSYNSYIAFLLIHGILHIKGYKHGSNMEKKENSILKKLKLS